MVRFTYHNLSISIVKITKFHFLYTKTEVSFFKAHVSIVDLFWCITLRYTWNMIYMSVSCLYNMQSCVRIKILVSVAKVKRYTWSLIYIMWCCNNSIVDSNVKKPYVANLCYIQRSRQSNAISTHKLLGKITQLQRSW